MGSRRNNLDANTRRQEREGSRVHYRPRGATRLACGVRQDMATVATFVVSQVNCRRCLRRIVAKRG